jgi:hypothetical protein
MGRTWTELAERLGVPKIQGPGSFGIVVSDTGTDGTPGGYCLATLLHSALDALVPEPGPILGLASDELDEDPDLWTHGKTGGQYALLTDTARLEWLGMQSPDYCVYVNADSGETWIRPRGEFFGPDADGRPRFTLGT